MSSDWTRALAGRSLKTTAHGREAPIWALTHRAEECTLDAMAEPVWFVVPVDSGWMVRERTAADGEIHPSREAAIARAEALAAAAAPARYMIRRADGTIVSSHRVGRTRSGVIAAVRDEVDQHEEVG